MNQIIKLSDNAAERIKEIMSNAEKDSLGVRVSVKSGGCAGMSYVMEYTKELNPNDEVIVTEFGFIMYKIYASLSRAKVILAKEKNFKASVEEIIKKVSDKTKIVFIANPNNPTGTFIPKKEFTKYNFKINKKK